MEDDHSKDRPDPKAFKAISLELGKVKFCDSVENNFHAFEPSVKLHDHFNKKRASKADCDGIPSKKRKVELRDPAESENSDCDFPLSESEESTKRKTKTYVEFKKWMEDSGYDRFFFMYFCKEQIRLGNDITRYTQNPFELDATAGVVLQIPRKSGQRRDIYLTNLVSRIGGETGTLASVLSKKNDANFLSYFLNEYQRHDGKPPKRMVIDMGKALQAAINMSYNECSFKTYNSRYLRTIIGGGDIFEYDIRTQLMTDVAHFSHATSNWACFTKAESKVKELFMRCLGFMTDID
ncbi:hypothetical protein QAD02_021556 [Eretmocerus hayati]|uniref:Uncharacterized protein n=1 Tax=Eretmocerus hayati TaxID=131215 RepID=A0ACC2PQL8_9HYME|nr:hypothetical protein QAD02_021556 [Eretmocerus hayati]